MRRFILGLMVFWLLGIATVAAAPVFGTPVAGEARSSQANCRIYYLRVNDPAPPLNVHSTPESAADNVIATLPNGALALILQEQDGWFKIALRNKQLQNKTGWIKADRTEYGCNLFAEPVQPPFVMRGRLIGTGSHKYIIELKSGQTLLIRPQRPTDASVGFYWPSAVIGPDISGRQAGVPNAYGNWWRKPGDTTSPEPSEWRWTSENGGIYEVCYESNFKGFVYGPSVLEVEER